jgi:hypothetical protein
VIEHHDRNPAGIPAADNIKNTRYLAMEQDISRILGSTETLRTLYKTLLNPATLSPNLLDGEGESLAEQQDSKRSKTYNTQMITGAAVDKMMSASMLLSENYRLSLYRHIRVFIESEATYEDSPRDMAATWEKVYGFIISKIADYDKNALTTVLSKKDLNLPDDDRHQVLGSFESALDNQKQQASGGGPAVLGGPHPPGAEEEPTDVITQLTCSTELAAAITREALDNDVFRSYDVQKASIPQAADGLMSIGAGEMRGEVTGMNGTNGMNRYGIKRASVGAGASDSYPDRPEWKLEWAGGRLNDRIASCKNLFTTALHRTVSLALLGTPITQPALAHFIQSNVVFPFNMIYARPYMTYDMSTGVCMKTGNTTGETLIGHADFQLGDNVVQKLHYGNFTFYSKSVVYRQQNVYLAEDMFSTGYIGGNGTEWFKTMNDMEDYTSGVKVRHKSIFAMLAPYSDVEYPNPIDITGQYSGDCQALNVDGKLHYASAPFYRHLWNWGSQGTVPMGRNKFDTPDAVMNTVCFQGHQSMFNPGTSMFDVVIKNTGHWGDRVYPGCGKVRSGMQKTFDAVNYNNVYGGGGSMTGVTMSK